MKTLKINSHLNYDKSENGEIIFYNPNIGKTYLLNETASILLDCCDSNNRYDALSGYYKLVCKKIKTNIDKNTIINDAKLMLDDLLKNEILVEENSNR